MSDLTDEELAALQAVFADETGMGARVRTVIEELQRLREDAEDSERVRIMMRDILIATANALKGEPGELRSHSWHDLAEVAARVRLNDVRYRWLRDTPDFMDGPFVYDDDDGNTWLTGEALDRRVDAARVKL